MAAGDDRRVQVTVGVVVWTPRPVSGTVRLSVFPTDASDGSIMLSPDDVRAVLAAGADALKAVTG